MRRSYKPYGMAMWIIQTGFALVAVVGVLMAVLIAKWHSEYSQLQLALTASLHTAVAQSYQNEALSSAGSSTTTQTGMMSQMGMNSGSTVTLSPTRLTAALQKSTTSALGATAFQSCVTMAGAPGTCSGSVAPIWWAVPVSPIWGDPPVVDIGENANTSTNTIQMIAVMEPRPFFGFQVPLVAKISGAVNLGQTSGVQAY